MQPTNASQNDILVAELEDALGELAPEEAISAGAYVNDPEASLTSNGERPLSLPAGEIAQLVGPVALGWMVKIAIDLLVQMKSAALKKLAEAAVARIAKALPSIPPKQSEAIDAIAAALQKAGWPPAKAHSAAPVLYQAGRRTAEQLHHKS